MRQAGLSGLITKKWRATTIRVPGVRVADDLLDRNFAAGAPNRCWVADITYLRTWEGWLYLVAVQDLYSRRIVGWAMADHMRAELVTDALEMALAHRRPDRGLIWHSDQGSQFVSLAFGQKARAAGIAQSMGSKGDCFDNAVAESFFATLKKELINRRSWPTKAELRTEVFDYIEVFYNRERRHSTLGQRSPADYEKINHPSTKNKPPNQTLSTEDIRDALAQLPERQRLVLFLRYFADLDYESIAAALEITSGTVGATLNKAHAALREHIQEVPSP